MADTFDVVVVGGGPAGCVLAARLSENVSRSVCLVEAGPDYGPLDSGRWPPEMLDAGVIPDTHDWRDSHGSLPWARVIGGCSSHNACFVVAGPPSDYEWSDGWTWEAIRPYLMRAREKIRTRTLETVGAWHEAFREAAVALGIPRVADLGDPEVPEAVANLSVNSVGTIRWNAALAYLDPARDRPNLAVQADVRADRVIVSEGRARGVLVRSNGTGRELQAPLVVVTCGAYGSPALLLHSGIGPASELSRHGIEVVEALPGVGEGLVDHARVGFGFSLRGDMPDILRDAPAEHRAAAQVLMTARSAMAPPGAPDLHLFPMVRTTEDGGHEGRITVGLVGARSRGSVTLRSADPEELPVVDSAFLREPDDLRAIVEGMEEAREIAATPPLSDAIEAELEPGLESDLHDYARTTVSSYYHPIGTCAIGEVVDGRGAVHGIEGLHVADGAVIPHSPHANTHLTVLAVAERIAELLDSAS